MQRATTSHNESHRPIASHNQPQQPTATHSNHPKIAWYNFMYTLCFIYNKTIISCFYEAFIFNFQFSSVLICQIETQLLSAIWLKHNSCLSSDLTKLRRRHRLLSKKLKIAKQFTFGSQIFITCWSDISIWLHFQVKSQHKRLL